MNLFIHNVSTSESNLLSVGGALHEERRLIEPSQEDDRAGLLINTGAHFNVFVYGDSHISISLLAKASRCLGRV